MRQSPELRPGACDRRPQERECGCLNGVSPISDGWHRHVSLVMLVFAVLARVRQRADGPPQEPGEGPSSPMPWSLQEIRPVATRLAQRCIEPPLVVAWSSWLRAHRAATRQAYLRRRRQL
ncbi:hypothetical protein FF100_15380 [Methylobacterium terricola]|uniref:Uncharacterized protein n=1 Tax=Methylobacterium terricola TaxID=2583531 RepID=A0A5C4LKU7_9HYPH|nr:hypothetical protein FF100_15380 [Methylobacterium terricola]